MKILLKKIYFIFIFFEKKKNIMIISMYSFMHSLSVYYDRIIQV